jgi:hypothetical protein
MPSMGAKSATVMACPSSTISARCPPEDSVSATALPPSSTWSPSVSALLAVSTTAHASPSAMSSAWSSKVTEAYAVRPSPLMRPVPGPS